jgi:two-component system, NtrC family, sensor histidine kinase HydH
LSSSDKKSVSYDLQWMKKLSECASEYLLAFETSDTSTRFLELAQSVLAADGSLLYMHNPTEGCPKLVQSLNIPADVIDLLNPVLVQNIHLSSLPYNFPEIPGFLGRILVFPFFRGHQMEGVLAFIRFSPSSDFDEVDIERATILANSATGIFYSSAIIRRLRGQILDNQHYLNRLYLMYETSNALVKTQELDQRLFIVLTTTTLEEGLAFNRAILYLVEGEGSVLQGKIGLGPDSAAEAAEIWSRLAKFYKPPYEWLREIIRDKKRPTDAINSRVVAHRISLSDDRGVFARTVREQRAFIVSPEIKNIEVTPADLEILHSDVFATVPLILGDQSIGLIAVDNRFSRNRINPEDFQYLWMIANLATAAIDNAAAYDRLYRVNLELKRTRETLMRAEKISAVGEMALYLAHEIRNPLVAIGGFARRLVSQLENSSKEKEYASIILSETVRLENILKNLFDSSKKQVLDIVPCNLPDIVHEVVDFLSFYLEENQIQIHLDLFESHPLILADEMLLRQALHNIIQNAVQAQPDGGHIRIDSFMDQDIPVLRIADAGPGVPPEKLKDIFTPFYTTKADGAGLGLPYVKRILESFGAAIHATLPNSGGLCFLIRFETDISGGKGNRNEKDPRDRR